MVAPLSTDVAARMRQVNQQVLDATRELSDEQLSWQPNVHAPSIAFHLWHSARWADRVQAALPGMAPQLADRLGAGSEIWQSEGLAVRWGLTTGELGRAETGLGMSDEVASGLVLPTTELLDYATRAFDALDQSFAAVDDATLGAHGPDANGRDASVGAAMLSHLSHVSRHLGMIESLRGVQGMRGSASA